MKSSQIKSAAKKLNDQIQELSFQEVEKVSGGNVRDNPMFRGATKGADNPLAGSSEVLTNPLYESVMNNPLFQGS